MLHFGLGTRWVPTHQYVETNAVMAKNSAKKFRLRDRSVLDLIVLERGAVARTGPNSSWGPTGNDALAQVSVHSQQLMQKAH